MSKPRKPNAVWDQEVARGELSSARGLDVGPAQGWAGGRQWQGIPEPETTRGKLRTPSGTRVPPIMGHNCQGRVPKFWSRGDV